MSDDVKRPPAPDRFGVTGLLGPDCAVYYDNLFSSRHIGRVSDLLVAKLREVGMDELRIRALLLFGFFEAYRTHANAAGTDILPEPLVLECGIDSEQVAIGFTFKTGIGLDTDGLVDRVAQGAPNGFFETLLCELQARSDRLIVRVHPGVQAEVITLCGIGGAPSEKLPPELAVLDDGTGSDREIPEGVEYVQLADLDYAALLRADGPGQALQRPPSGEFLAQGCTELEDAIRLKAQLAALEKKFKVAGGAEVVTEEVIRVKGQSGDLVDNSVIRVKAAEGEDEGESGPIVVRGGEGEKPAQAIKGLFKKVWPFKKKDQELEELEAIEAEIPGEEDVPEGEYDVDAIRAGLEEAAQGAEALEEAEQANDVQGDSEVEAAAESLRVEIEKGSLDRTIDKAQKELIDIKKDVSSSKAKRWMDGLMGDLVAEKSRLADLTKKLNQSIRQKEHEFKTREIALQEEMRRRDEMLKQKNNALIRTKEQLNQVSMTLEKFKAASQEKAEDALYKQKFAVTQKILASTKDENSKLNAKVDELKAQLASAQMGIKSRSGPSQTEFSALKVKHEKLVRQAEQMREMNDQLTSRIQQLADRVDTTRAPAGVTEKRLEAAMKQVAAGQKEVDLLKLRVEELQREDARIKMELKRSQVELKAAKTYIANRGVVGGGKPGAGTGSGGTGAGGAGSAA